MPALTIPSPSNDLSSTPSDAPTPSEREESQGDDQHGRPPAPGSPQRPPVSPITPIATLAQLAPVDPPAPQRPPAATVQPTKFISHPPPVPISESENPDAIALRSAISLLQLQREKSKRDLTTLAEMKGAAVSDPTAFMRAMQEKQRQPRDPKRDILTPTLSDLPDGPLSENVDTETQPHSDSERKDSADLQSKTRSDDTKAKFSAIPQPQNIIRTPPINWAKYHIVGEPLDKMHEEQRRSPGTSESQRGQPGPRPHAIAAPYSPFTDRGGDPHPAQPRKSSKKSPS